mmetsp:Transcript_46164/g.91211  ORF Transcript_46164/g.91211 Transcript_46164/m.91211 type:complete len:115 (+) Transcript_46164:140-484(+)
MSERGIDPIDTAGASSAACGGGGGGDNTSGVGTTGVDNGDGATTAAARSGSAVWHARTGDKVCDEHDPLEDASSSEGEEDEEEEASTLSSVPLVGLARSPSLLFFLPPPLKEER